MSASLSELMTEHHKACDDAWALAEQCASEARWADAGAALQNFLDGMARHLTLEENVIFPAFEAATGITQGPTRVMRFEHDHLRALFQKLEAALAAKDEVGFAGAGETMLVLMQQHNMKEEHMLYPACDSSIGGDAALLTRVEAALEHAR